MHTSPIGDLLARCRLLFLMLALCVLGTVPVQAQDEEATTRVGRINVQPGPTNAGPGLPADLAMNVQFTEPSGNNMVDANETGSLVVSLNNQGQGKAQGIDVWVSSDTTLPSGLTIGPTDGGQTTSSARPVAEARPVARLKSLEASESEVLEIPLQADRSIPDGEFPLTVHVTETNGFGPSSPVQVQFPTRAFRPPVLALAGHAVGGSGMEDGQIDPSEIINVQMRVLNEGRGPAEGVSVTVEKGSPNVFFTASSKRRFEVGDLRPSEKQDLSVQVYANNRARSIPIILRMEEKRDEFSVTDTLRLDLNQPEQELRTVVAEAERKDETVTTEANYNSLGIDIEQDIPETPAENENAVAIVLGLEEYPSEQVPDVKYAHRDAVFMRKYLTKVLGYEEQNILPQEPTRRMTVGQMKTLFQQRLPSYVRDSADVFVYYSGHGAPGPDGEHAYLVPSDADPNYVGESNAYRLDRFREDLARVAEQNNLSSLTVVLDACFSGQSKQGDMLIRQASSLTLSAENPLLLQDNATVFTAGTADQVANWYPEMKHGMFTYFFLKGLRGEADANDNEAITVAELKQYILDENNGVPYWSQRLHGREQTPQIKADNSERVLVQYANETSTDR